MKNKIYLLIAAALSVVLAGGIIFAVLFRASLLGERWIVPVSTEKTLEEVSPEKAPDRMTTIILEGNSASITGEGADFYGGVLTIHAGGNYTLQGTLEPGRIVVNTKGKDTVTLYLEDAKVYHPSEAALEVKSEGRTLLVLKKDTVNRLQSGTDRTPASHQGEGAGAAVYAKKDLLVAGDGALQVLGYIHNGIQAGGRLTLESGKVDAVAAGSALIGSESVSVQEGEFSLKSGGNGILSDSTSGEGHGVVAISGGSFIIKSGGDAIRAQTLLNIEDGVFSIAAGNYEEGAPFSGGDGPKGLISEGDIRIANGSIAVESPDDALHAGKNLLVVDGSLTLHAGRNGLYAQDTLSVNGGTLSIAHSLNGIESSEVFIHDGQISVYSTAEGIYSCRRSAGGSLPALYIKGGSIDIHSGGNGLSSDGSLYIESGNTTIGGPDESARALRFSPENGGVCQISGGILLTADSAGLQNTAGISKRFLFHRFSTPIEAGNEIVISTQGGNVLLSYTLESPAASVFFTSPDLLPWLSYRITAGEQRAEPMPRRGDSGQAWWKFWERW